MNLDGLRKGVLVRNRVSRNLGIVRRVRGPFNGQSATVAHVEIRLFWWETRRRWFTEDRNWKARNCLVLSEAERQAYLAERGPRKI